MQATVIIAKIGEPVEFDSTTLPDASNLYAWVYGLNQSINDSHAAVARKNFDTDEEFHEAVRSKAMRRVEQIRSGEVPGTRAPASPATKLGRQVASAAVEAGVDVSKIDPAKLLAALRKLAA